MLISTSKLVFYGHFTHDGKQIKIIYNIYKLYMNKIKIKVSF